MTAADQEQTEAIRQLVPFAAALGVEVITSSPDEVRARVLAPTGLITGVAT